MPRGPVASRGLQAAAAAACCLVAAILVVSSRGVGPTSLAGSAGRLPLSAAASAMMFFQAEHPRTAKELGERKLAQSAVAATEAIQKYATSTAAPAAPSSSPLAPAAVQEDAAKSAAKEPLSVKDLPADWFQGGIALTGKQWAAVLGDAVDRANTKTRAKLVPSKAVLGPDSRCDQEHGCTGLYQRLLPGAQDGAACPVDKTCELHQAFLPCYASDGDTAQQPLRKEALCPLYVFSAPGAGTQTAALRGKGGKGGKQTPEGHWAFRLPNVDGSYAAVGGKAAFAGAVNSDPGTLDFHATRKYDYPADGPHWLGEYTPKDAHAPRKAHDSASGRGLPGVNVYGSLIPDFSAGRASAASKRAVQRLDHSRPLLGKVGAKVGVGKSVSSELWHMLYDQAPPRPEHGRLPGVLINDEPGLDNGIPNPFGSILKGAAAARTTQLAAAPHATTQELAGLAGVLARREGAARARGARASSLAARQAAVLRRHSQSLLKDFFSPAPAARAAPAGPRDRFVRARAAVLPAAPAARAARPRLPGVNLWGLEAAAPTQELALPAAAAGGGGGLFADATARAPREPRIDYSRQRDDAFASFGARDGAGGDAAAPCRDGDAALCAGEWARSGAVVEVGGHGRGRRALERAVRRAGGVPLQKLGMDLKGEGSDVFVPYVQGEGAAEDAELGAAEGASAGQAAMDEAEGEESEEEEARDGAAEETKEAEDGEADEEGDDAEAAAQHKELIPADPSFLTDTPLDLDGYDAVPKADMVDGRGVFPPHPDTIMDDQRPLGRAPGVNADSLGPLTADASTRPREDNSLVPDPFQQTRHVRIPSDQAVDERVGTGAVWPKSHAWRSGAQDDDLFVPPAPARALSAPGAAPEGREHGPLNVQDGCVDNDGDYLCD